MPLQLSPDAERAGHRLVVFDTIGSTNIEATERARAGEAGPLWLVARRQTDGRGRRGSAWHSPDGNLAATLLLTTDLQPATIAQLGFVAGVALVRALDRCFSLPGGEGGSEQSSETGGAALSPDSSRRPSPLRRPFELPPSRAGEEKRALPTFSLKWPNDVLADGAKLAGILLGSEEVAAGRRAVAVGVGVNVATAPRDLPYPATSLRAQGSDAAADDLFEALSASWVEAATLWDRGRGFDAIRGVWLARAAGLGEPASVRSGTGRLHGIFDTIDDRGQLVLRDVQGRATFVSAGEVYFGIAASAAMEAVV